LVKRLACTGSDDTLELLVGAAGRGDPAARTSNGQVVGQS
jgi:hypothetical protein